MKKTTFAVLGFSVLGGIASASTMANAMPIAPMSVPNSNVEQVRYICNAWGRCWWRPSYRVYGPRYYGPRFYYGFGPRFYGYGPAFGPDTTALGFMATGIAGGDTEAVGAITGGGTTGEAAD